MSRIILLLSTILLAVACSTNKGSFSAAGVVESIEQGKDGYTAYINSGGKKIAAVISRVNMGENYVKLEVGETAKVYGEKIDLGDHISVKVTKIKH